MTIRMLHSVGPRMQATKWWYKWWARWAKHINWVRLSDSDTIPWLGWWENLQKAAQNLVVKPRLCCKCSLRSIHKLIWQKSTKNHGQKAWHCLDHVHSIDHKSWFHPPLNFSVNDVYMAMVSKFVDPKKWMASVRKAQVYACGSYMDRCFTSNINLSNGPVAFSENMLPFPPKKKHEKLSGSSFIMVWLVVYLPLWKIWVRELGLWHSQYMESHEIHVPNHQPVV